MFTKIPNAIIRHDDLDAYDVRVYAVVASFNPSFPSYDTIAQYAKCSRDKVWKSLKKLIYLGFLECKSGNSHRSNQYRIPDKNFSPSGRLTVRHTDSNSLPGGLNSVRQADSKKIKEKEQLKRTGRSDSRPSECGYSVEGMGRESIEGELEALYVQFPKRGGRTMKRALGMEILKRSIKDRATLDQFKLAVVNYAESRRRAIRNGDESRFTCTWESFAKGEWFDWVDPRQLYAQEVKQPEPVKERTLEEILGL